MIIALVAATDSRLHVSNMGEASKILRKGCGNTVLIIAAMLIAQACLAASSELPATAPVPTRIAGEPARNRTGRRAEIGADPHAAARSASASTDVAPQAGRAADGAPRDLWATSTTEAGRQREPVDVQEERLCLDDLRALGVDFEPTRAYWPIRRRAASWTIR